LQITLRNEVVGVKGPEARPTGERLWELPIDRAQTIRERLPLLHQTIHLREHRTDLSPVRIPKLAHRDQLLLQLLALQVHLLEAPGVVQNVSGEIRWIEDDPAA
jgi:hypothetical protein